MLRHKLSIGRRAANAGVACAVIVALIMPTRAEARVPDRSRNEIVLDVVLGTLLTLLSVGILAHGSWELHQGLELRRACMNGTSRDPLCGRDDPTLGHRIGAGLSFAFVVPLAAGGTWMLIRGAGALQRHRSQRNRQTAGMHGSRFHWAGRSLHLQF